MNDNIVNPIVGIGGVGGSGTRVLAQILLASGLQMGRDRNHSEDNLWFTLLFKRVSLHGAGTEEISVLFDLFSRAMAGKKGITTQEIELLESLALLEREQHSSEWLTLRMESLRSALEEPGSSGGRWGWKEPNTHFFVPRLLEVCRELKYLHLIRHGLDMAYSTNQNQLKFWGNRVISTAEATPRNSLTFWIECNLKVLELAKLNPSSILILKFEDICLETNDVLDRLSEFAGCCLDENNRRELLESIHPPASIGRYRSFDLGEFRREDLDRLETFGYQV